MEFNLSTCEAAITFTKKMKPVKGEYKLHYQVLTTVPSARSKYLGVHFNSKLSWNDHVDITTKKASQTLNSCFYHTAQALVLSCSSSSHFYSTTFTAHNCSRLMVRYCSVLSRCGHVLQRGWRLGEEVCGVWGGGCRARRWAGGTWKEIVEGDCWSVGHVDWMGDAVDGVGWMRQMGDDWWYQLT